MGVVALMGTTNCKKDADSSADTPGTEVPDEIAGA